MRKLSIYFLTACALVAGSTVMAQSSIKVQQNTFALIGDSVHVEMTIEMSNAKVRRNSYVMLTPTIKSDKATVDMPSVLINGKARHIAYNRLVTLKKAPKYIHSEINAGGRKAPRTYKYSATVPFELWMMDAVFILREDLFGCNGALLPTSLELLAKSIEDRNPPLPPPYKDVQMNFAVSYIVPNPEPVKARSEVGKAYLDFAAGRSAINPDMGNNAAELEKIGEMIRTIKANQYATVTGIVVNGYASPDGSASANLALSKNRAVSLKNFIKNNYGYSENILTASGKGEDWVTFEQIVEESEIAGKEQILNIIRNGKSEDIRERELKALNGGATFRMIMSNISPKLRRSDYELKYTIVPLTVEQGKEVIKTAPGNLSLNEMFLIAETHPKESAEYNEVFEIAAMVYPDNDISNLNAAANALARNETATAERFLAKVKSHDAAYHNNMGIMHALKREYSQASYHFGVADKISRVEASYNLSELLKIKEVDGDLILK